MTGWDIVRTGIVQGVGLGMTYVPLTTVTFSTRAYLQDFRRMMFASLVTLPFALLLRNAVPATTSGSAHTTLD